MMSRKFNNSSATAKATSLAEDLFSHPLDDTDYRMLPAVGDTWPTRVFMFSRRQGFRHMAPSHHERFVLVLALHGDGLAHIDGRLINIPEGGALLVFAYQFHHFIRLTSPKLSWLMITFAADQAQWLLPLRDRCVPISPQCLGEIERIVADFRNKRMPDRTKSPIVSSRLRIILSMLLEAGSSTIAIQPAGDDPPLGPSYRAIHKVAQAISEDPSRLRGVADAAEVAGLSPSYLQEIFHQLLGCGVGFYIRKHKVLRAARLLKLTDDSISQIADDCGFTSVYAFSRTFSAVMRESPRAFRARST